jgi:hypothetical protein
MLPLDLDDPDVLAWAFVSGQYVSEPPVATIPKEKQMHLNPYLIFNGNAEEALEHYRSAIGGEVEIMRVAPSSE